MPIMLGTVSKNLPFSKAYLGDVLKYEKISYVDTVFTSCPFPTSWTQVTKGTKYKATNSYGTWQIWADSYTKSFGTECVVSYAFDGNTTTRYYSPAGTRAYAGIDLPPNVLIKPTKIFINGSWTVGSTLVQGLNENGEWETIVTTSYSGELGSQFDALTTYTVTTNKFYSKFRMYLVNSNVYPTVNEFQIQSGTIRQL